MLTYKISHRPRHTFQERFNGTIRMNVGSCRWLSLFIDLLKSCPNDHQPLGTIFHLGQAWAWQILPERKPEKDQQTFRPWSGPKQDDAAPDAVGQRRRGVSVVANREGEPSREWRHSSIHQWKGQATGTNNIKHFHLDFWCNKLRTA